MFGIDPTATKTVDTGAIRWLIGMIPLDVLEELETGLASAYEERRQTARAYVDDKGKGNALAFGRASVALAELERKACQWGLRGAQVVPGKEAPKFLGTFTPWEERCETVEHAGRSFQLLKADAMDLLGRVNAKRPLTGEPETAEHDEANQHEALPLTRWLASEIMAAQRLSGDDLLGF